MASKSGALVAALVLAVITMQCSADPQNVSEKPRGKGTQFMDWLNKELPVMAVKAADCLKKNTRDVSSSLSGLLGDIGKCFDETKGSILYTIECMLRNSMGRIISTVSVTHKVIDCLGYKTKDGRLCISISNVRDEACPLLVGV